MVAPFITAAGFALWAITAFFFARTAEAILDIMPGTRDAYREISQGHVRPRHIFAVHRLYRLLRKGPRAALLAAKAEVVRMWILGLAAAAAAIMFVGSCFLWTGWREFQLGILAGVWAAMLGAFVSFRLIAVTRRTGARGLWDRLKKLPDQMFMHSTARTARNVAFLGLIWFGLAFLAIDFFTVGAVRHFAHL